MHIMIAQLWACATPPTEPSPAVEAPSEQEEQQAKARKVTETPPATLAFAEVTAKLAAAYGVGVVQCPVSGAGKVQRVHGLPRDLVMKIGPTWLVEVDDDIPWSPTYDGVTVEDGWITILAKPGSTEGFIRSSTTTTRLIWAPAEAGKTQTCTDVAPVPERVVVGKVAPRSSGMFALGCTEESVKVARDGTYVVDARVPCTLWLETDDAHRTDHVQIPAGEGKHKLDPTAYQPDPLQNADRSWTDEGKKALQAVATKMEKNLNWEQETLTAIESELDPKATSQHSMLRKWRTDLQLWRDTLQHLKEGLAGKGPL